MIHFRKANKLTRIVWSINGYLLLALLAIGLGQLVTEKVSDWGRLSAIDTGIVVGDIPSSRDSLSGGVQHLEYDSPTRIEGSDYYFSPVYVMDTDVTDDVLAQLEEVVSSAGDVPRRLLQARVNVLFFKSDLSDVRALFSNPAYIDEIAAPQHTAIHRGNQVEYPLGNRMLYKLALRDSNGDHRLNEQDDMAYFLSDSSGRDLVQITPDSLIISRYWFLEGTGHIAFESLETGTVEAVQGFRYQKRTRRIYTYDLETGTFESFDELQNVFDKIRIGSSVPE